MRFRELWRKWATAQFKMGHSSQKGPAPRSTIGTKGNDVIAVARRRPAAPGCLQQSRAPGGNHMSLRRAAVPVISVFLALTLPAASAEQPELSSKPAAKLPRCSQSMIVGTAWQAFFTVLSNRGFACPINIATTGTLTSASGNCTLPDGFALAQPPSGVMTIDHACRVTGTITYGFCDSVAGWCRSPQLCRSPSPGPGTLTFMLFLLS